MEPLQEPCLQGLRMQEVRWQWLERQEEQALQEDGGENEQGRQEEKEEEGWQLVLVLVLLKCNKFKNNLLLLSKRGCKSVSLCLPICLSAHIPTHVIS